MRVAVVSSIYNQYDPPPVPSKQDTACEWVMVTDVAEMPAPWRVVTEPRPQWHPRLAAKVAKCSPDHYADADILIWADGNLIITAPDFVSWCVAVLGDAPLAQHRNPARQTIYDEVAVASPMQKYAGQPLRAQADHYVATGFPATFGTWWTGLIIRRRTCPDFGAAWLDEMIRWTHEDQISQPYVLHALGLRPADLPIDWPSSRFERRDHASSH